MRALTASAAAGAAGSTIAYGLFPGFLPLLIARLVWGMAYAVLNVTTTAYAIGDGQRLHAVRRGPDRWNRARLKKASKGTAQRVA